MNVSAELNGQRLARSMRSLRSLPFYLGVSLSVVLARVRSRNLFFSRARDCRSRNSASRLKVLPAINSKRCYFSRYISKLESLDTLDAKAIKEKSFNAKVTQ